MFVGIFSEKSTEYFSFKCTRCEYSNEIGENRMELKTIEVVTQMFVKTVFQYSAEQDAYTHSNPYKYVDSVQLMSSYRNAVLFCVSERDEHT